MGKVIGRFDPTPSRTPEECERHYTGRWGEEALGALAAGGALRDPALLGVNLLRVEEQAPLDVTGR